jgi:hypothetical protein
VRRRCDVLLGHRRRWGTHTGACVGPAQAARARYLPGTMPGPALHRRLGIHGTAPSQTHHCPPLNISPLVTTEIHHALTAKLSATKDDAQSAI